MKECATVSITSNICPLQKPIQLFNKVKITWCPIPGCSWLVNKKKYCQHTCIKLHHCSYLSLVHLQHILSFGEGQHLINDIQLSENAVHNKMKENEGLLSSKESKSSLM